MTTPNLHRQVEASLSEVGVRFTSARRNVVNALVDASGPRSATELHDDLGATVPLSTLYRTLSVLEDVGVAVPHFAGKNLARYELAEWLTGHHHHLVCIECGQVEDVAVPQEYESQVDSVVSAVASTVSFLPTNHALEIEGRCARCA